MDKSTAFRRACIVLIKGNFFQRRKIKKIFEKYDCLESINMNERIKATYEIDQIFFDYQEKAENRWKKK